MALTTTTLSSACGASDQSIVVASATGFAAGSLILIDGEVLKVRKDYVSGTTIGVLRGLDGSKRAAHPVTANVTVGLASDFALPVEQGFVDYAVVGRGRQVSSYTAAGAIALPNPGSDALAILNGTNAIAMTIANPTKDMDGSILIIVGNGKAAHTVTYTAGLGNAGGGYDVGTFDTGGQCSVMLIAANAIWVPLPSPFSGTLTAIDVAIA
jgi:hypothetical protein